jgi:hypothetical protein
MTYLTIARVTGDPEHLLAGYRQTSPLMDEVGRDHGLILHAGARTADGLLIVNLWPEPAGPEAAAADPRRLAALRQSAVREAQLTQEHHELERCVLWPGVTSPPAGAARPPRCR